MMNWTRLTRRCKANDSRAIGVILLWVVLYFNVYRFAVVRAVGQAAPLAFKLIAFLLFLLTALHFANGGYKAVLTQTPGKLSPALLTSAFVVSMAFAVFCADRQILFRVLSLSVFVFDRLLYFAFYKKRFRSKKLVPP